MVTLADYHHLEKELLAAGFRHDSSTDAPVCRWTVGAALVDVMPADERVLGFGNRWYRDAIRTAEPFPLPSSGTIRLITAPLFLATKLEAETRLRKGAYPLSWIECGRLLPCEGGVLGLRSTAHIPPHRATPTVR